MRTLGSTAKYDTRASGGSLEADRFQGSKKIHHGATEDTEKTRKKIARIIKTSNYHNGRDFYTNTLALGIAQIANAFHPREVIVRLSDFKTNEYRHLLGGDEFEPYEQNPMLGWRGAARYYDPKFQAAFAMECKALKKCAIN